MNAIAISLTGLLAAVAFAPPEAEILGSHEGTTRVAITSDGALAASTGDKTIKIWNIETSKLVHTHPIDSAGLSLAFTPHKKSIAVRLESSVDLIAVESGERLRRFDSHTGGVPRIAISADGKWLASGGSDNKLRVWELTTGKLVHELSHQYHLVFGVQFSPDSKRIITGSGDGVATHGEVKSWDVDTGKNVWRYDGKQIWMVAVLPDSSAAVSTDVNGAIVVHNWDDGSEVRTFQTSDSCRALAVSADGKLLAASARRQIEIWELGSGAKRSALHAHENWVLSLAFRPDSSALVSGSSDNTVRLWRLPVAESDKD